MEVKNYPKRFQKAGLRFKIKNYLRFVLKQHPSGKIVYL